VSRLSSLSWLPLSPVSQPNRESRDNRALQRTGDFSEPTFSFAVHSPAMSGLEKGRSYTVKAVWKNGGYVVDPLQWRRGNQIRPCIVTPEPANKALQRPIALPRCARAGARR